MRNNYCKLAMKFALQSLRRVGNGVNYQCHLAETLKYGRLLRKIYGGDKEVVELACVLHDLGMKEKVENHGVLGAKMANPFLESIPRISSNKKNQILNSIANHNKKPQLDDSLELKIVRDADGITNLKNPTAIALLFYRSFYDEERKFLSGIKKALDRCNSTYQALVFPESKQIAKPGHVFLEIFFNDILDYFKEVQR